MIEWAGAMKVLQSVGLASARAGVQAVGRARVPKRVAKRAHKAARARGLRFGKGELQTALEEGSCDRRASPGRKKRTDQAPLENYASWFTPTRTGR